MIGNAMGNGYAQDPNQQQMVLEWLRSVGYDVEGMGFGGMGMPSAREVGYDPRYGGPPRTDPRAAAPRGMGAMSAQEQEMLMRAQQGQQGKRGASGGGGWDGVNEKLNYLRDVMAQKRATRKGLGGIRSEVLSGKGGGLGAMSNQEMNAAKPRSGPMSFGEIGKFLGRIF